LLPHPRGVTVLLKVVNSVVEYGHHQFLVRREVCAPDEE